MSVREGCDERRSETAVFAPMTLSMNIMSRRTEPVSVADGISNDPVSMRAVIPSCSSAQTFAYSASILRAVPSVPCSPTTVVMPCLTMADTCISGVRLKKPASPPAPMTWTCWSTKPGVSMQPSASRTSTSSPPYSSASLSPIFKILPKPIRTSLRPSGSGAYTSALRIKYIASHFLYDRDI